MVQNRAPQITAVSILFISLSWITTLLRCYVRVFVVKHFGADDYLALISLAAFSVFQMFVLWGVHYGSGQHIVNIPLQNVPMALKQWFFAEIFYDLATSLTKFTIGVFLLRLAVKPAHIWIIRIVLGVIAAYATAYMGLIVFQCHPVDYFWLQYAGVPGGHCVKAIIVTIPTYIHTALNAWADWTLGLLPIFVIKDLDMNPRTKVTVMIILALGAIGSIASIIRLRYIGDLVQKDFLFAATDVAIWSTVEPGMGITAASLATLRPLFKNFLANTRFFSSSNNSANSSRPSRTSYRRSEKKTSTIYTSEHPMELGFIERTHVDIDRQFKLHELDMGEGVSKIVQTQADADEEEAQIRRKESSRNKSVSWGKVGPKDRSRSSASISPEYRVGEDWSRYDRKSLGPEPDVSRMI